jgi:hypothetical protein
LLKYAIVSFASSSADTVTASGNAAGTLYCASPPSLPAETTTVTPAAVSLQMTDRNRSSSQLAGDVP